MNVHLQRRLEVRLWLRRQLALVLSAALVGALGAML